MEQGTGDSDGRIVIEQPLDPEGDRELDDDLPPFPLDPSFDDWLNANTEALDGIDTTSNEPVPSLAPHSQSHPNPGFIEGFRQTQVKSVPDSLMNVFPLEDPTMAIPSAAARATELPDKPSPNDPSTGKITSRTPRQRKRKRKRKRKKKQIGDQSHTQPTTTGPLNEDAGNASGTDLQPWPFKHWEYVSHRPISMPIGVGVKRPAQGSPLLRLSLDLRLLILDMLDPVDLVILMLTCSGLARLASRIEIGPLAVGPLQVQLYGIPRSHILRMPPLEYALTRERFGLKPCDMCAQLRPCQPDAYKDTLPDETTYNDWIAAVAGFCLSGKRICPICQASDLQSALEMVGYEVTPLRIHALRMQLWIVFYDSFDGSWRWPRQMKP